MLLQASLRNISYKLRVVAGYSFFYGTGRGPVNTRSVQAPDIARATLKLKEGFRLGDGKNSWSNLHVQDLSDLIALLVDAAANSQIDGLWNRDGLYIPENGSLVRCPRLRFLALEETNAKRPGIREIGRKNCVRSL